MTQPPLQMAYIAGYGRSGSTLLDVLMGAHPQVLGAGELRHLFREARAGALCSCGSAVSACPVWRHALVPHKLDVWGRAERLTQHLEALGGFGRSSHGARQAYGRLWSARLRAMAQATGVRSIVDSSKSARDAWNRLRLLVHTTDLPVRVIHLVRDPRAVVHSLLRGSNRALERGAYPALRAALLRGAVNWLLVNWAVQRQLQRLQLPWLRMRYEDLTREPAGELNRVGRLLELDFAPVLACLERQQALPAGHGLAGNRMRRQPIQAVAADQAWMRAPGWRNRLVLALTGVLARRYGYR